MTGRAAGTSTLISLADSLEPLERRFNIEASRPHVMAIVSSTCGPCVAGSVAVNEAVVKAFPDADIAISIVWIDVLPSDSERTAVHASAVFDDPRVTQFHDPDQRAGTALAAGLIREPPAWDMYLVYPTGAAWRQGPPRPREWAHQLGGAKADPARFRGGADLASTLHAAMMDLGFEPHSGPPDERALREAGRSAWSRIERARGADSPDAAEGPRRCARCDARGAITSCSLGGWRRIEAIAVSEDGSGDAKSIAVRGFTDDAGSTAAHADDSGRALELHVTGLACSDCLVRAAGALLSVRGVQRVEIDYGTGVARVTIEPPGSVERSRLIDSLRLAGYEATSGSPP